MATVEWRTGAQDQSLARLREAIDEARRVGNNRQLGLLSAKLVGYYEELGNVDQMAAWTGVATEALPSHARVHLARARLSLIRNEFEAAEASLEFTKEFIFFSGQGATELLFDHLGQRLHQ